MKTRYTIKMDGTVIQVVTANGVPDKGLGRTLCNYYSVRHNARRSRFEFDMKEVKPQKGKTV